ATARSADSLLPALPDGSETVHDVQGADPAASGGVAATGVARLHEGGPEVRSYRRHPGSADLATGTPDLCQRTRRIVAGRERNQRTAATGSEVIHPTGHEAQISEGIPSRYLRIAATQFRWETLPCLRNSLVATL